MSRDVEHLLERALFDGELAHTRGHNDEALLTRDELLRALGLMPGLRIWLYGFELWELDDDGWPAYANYSYAPRRVEDQVKVADGARKALLRLPDGSGFRFALTVGSPETPETKKGGLRR
jgi:hypothetical protein